MSSIKKAKRDLSRTPARLGRLPSAARSTHLPATPGGTLGEELEVIRLTHRATRLERVLHALRTLTGDYLATSVPAGLRSAIEGFEAELAAVSARLALISATDRRSSLAVADLNHWYVE